MSLFVIRGLIPRCIQCTVAVLALTVGTLSGCKVYNNKYYEYSSVVVPFASGQIGAKLLGGFTSNRKETTKGSPYELFIWFHAKKKTMGTMTIKDIKIYAPEKQMVVYEHAQGLNKALFLDEAGKWSVYFSVKNLDLEYLRYIIKLSVELNQDGVSSQGEIELPLEKEYKEERSNRLWDRINSV